MMLTTVERQLGSLKLSKTMAEAAGAQSAPTFKLVLVGDGGTGKVSGQTRRPCLSSPLSTASKANASS